jgi:methionyl-tRNA formyltransferase
MRTVVAGNRKLAKYVLQNLIKHNWNVVGIIAPKGRLASQQANYQSFSDIADENNIKLIETSDINDDDTVSALESLSPDIVICPGWSQIISREVLNIPEIGFTGFHSSNLPKGRGGAPVNWSIINGETNITLSYFFYTPGIDAGDVLKQKSVTVEKRDDVSSIFEKLALTACQILNELKQPLHDGSIEAEPQQVSSATYRPRRKPKDGVIDWSKDPLEQYNWIRAQTQPYPGAYTFFEGDKITIWEAKQVGEVNSPDAEFGEIISVDDSRGICVQSGDENLRILRVQKDNEPIQWADDFARRNGIEAGITLGNHHAPESWLYTGIRGSDGGLQYETNLSVDEEGVIGCVMESPQCARQIRLEVSLDEETLIDKPTDVQGREFEKVSYSPNSEGTKTLKVRFTNNNSYEDVRYLKLFVD